MLRKKTDNILEGRVLALLQQKYSQVKILKYDEISISQTTVSNVKQKIDLQHNSIQKKLNFLEVDRYLHSHLYPKEIKQINVENLPTQRSIAQSCRVSRSTISRIKKRYNFVLQKQKVHKVTWKNIIDMHVDFINMIS